MSPRAPAANRALAAAIAAALLVSLVRTRGVDPAADGGAGDAGDVEGRAAAELEDAPRTPPSASGARLRIELQAEVGAGRTGPPVVLRLRPRDGATRPFDVTAREETSRQRLALEIALPVKDPELPLRAELIGEEWCIPPGRVELEIARLDPPLRLVLVRARAVEVALVAEATGAPVAGASLVHESGVRLARTALDGGARMLRPRGASARREELVLALAEGFLPAAVDEAARAPLPLRASSRAGVVRGRVVDADGAPVAEATVTPRLMPARAQGETPRDAAARAVLRAAVASGEREIPALARTTGATGEFELPLPWPGRLLLVAKHRELGRASSSLEDAGGSDAGKVTEIELRFPPTFELRVAATSAGAPAGTVALELVHRDASGPAVVAAAVTGSQGRATLRGPALAPLWLVARADGLAARILELAPDPARCVDAEVELDAGATVTFAVGGSEALEMAQRVVMLRDAASGFLLGEAPIDFEGRVRLDHVPRGRTIELLLAVGPAGTPLHQLELPEAVPDGPPPGEVDLGTLPLR